jgi:integrase
MTSVTTSSTKNKGGRPPGPTPQWDPARKRWWAMFTMPKPVDWPVGKEAPREPHDLPASIRPDQAEVAKAVAKTVAEALRRGEGIDPGFGETVEQWAARRYRWLADRPQTETLEQRKARWIKWVDPILGKLIMVDVTTDDIRRMAQHLEDSVADETIAPKYAINLWGEVTRAFADACEANDAAIRVRKDNPCDKVRGPERGELRSKPFLRPHEIMTLLSCEDVACYRRELYAVAIYTAARIGEIRALTLADVDFDAMQITIAKQADRFGDVKGKTKTRRARVVRIEPNLVPLLRILVARKGKRLLDVPNEDHAGLLRADLLMAWVQREALFADDDLRMQLTFHGLRDTCLTHMAVRRDPPQDVQWRAGHTTPATTERYIAQARYEAGDNFGTPLPPLPAELLTEAAREVSERNRGFGSSRREFLEESVRRRGLEPPAGRRQTSSRSAGKQADPAPIDVASADTFDDVSRREKPKPGDLFSDVTDAELEAAIVRASLDGRDEDRRLFTAVLRSKRHDRADVVVLDARRTRRP